MAHFSTQDATPFVEVKDVAFVTCIKKKWPCITYLRKKIYELALNVAVPAAGCY